MPGRMFTTILLSLTIVSCAADALRAPSLDDNKLYSACSRQLFETYSVVTSHKDMLSSPTKQKVISLLIAAEIDGQFKHYPACVDKLERARLFLKQAKLDLSSPSQQEPASRP